jgi:hypothetical protein
MGCNCVRAVEKEKAPGKPIHFVLSHQIYQLLITRIMDMDRMVASLHMPKDVLIGLMK